MRWFKWHPDERLLNRFADGELGEREHARIAGHLAGCPPCREEVGLVRRIGDVARTLPGPIATDEVLRRALARRGAGERVLLPMSDAGATRPVPVRRFAPAAAAAVLTLLMVGLVFSVRVLEADRPALRIHPERPAAGEPLRVEYHGGALFADQTHLALRARYRTADDHHWQLLAGVLARGEDGLYRTEVQLPDSVVYAAFAVEDLHGERLDSNNRELWDVMAHGEDGKPTLDAMTARTWDLEDRDWGSAYAQTLEMTEAYPSAPQSWAARFSYELGLFDPDSISAAHRAEFARLERAFIETSQPDPSAMAWLGIYAIDLGYLDSAERWIAGARSRGPTVPAVVMGETILLMVKHGHTPAELLPALENLWGRLPKRSGRVAHAGWQAAIAAGDMSATVRWADRYLRERPSEELALLPAVSAAEELRPQLRRWLEEFVAAPGRWNENDRPLHLPVHAYLKTVAERLQRAAAESAALAAGEGNTLEARRLAILGADLSWQPESLVQIARILISTRDSIEGLRILARAEADPGARPAVAVSPLTEIDSGWPDRVAEARSALREYVMDGAIIRYLPDDMRLLGPEGRVPFSEILEGHSTVVAFLSRYCAPALTDAARMPALAERVAELGADLVVVNIDNSPDLDAYLAAVGYNGAVYRDDRGEARSAFQSSATADYFVLDSAGRVRFEHSGFDELARQIWVLQSSEAPATVSD